MRPRPPVSHTRRVKEGPPAMEFLFFTLALTVLAAELNPAKDR